MSVTVAIDAMGGDRAPGEIVVGAVRAAEELGVRVILVGRDDAVRPLVTPSTSVEVVPAAEVIDMDEPATTVRVKKDASIVQCAQLVRDGKADALVSAGNTGATMAAALLRIGRIRGVARPAIATPVPVPGGDHGQILVDSGSTVDCVPEWLVQFAVMGREYARTRLGIDDPRIGLLSNGEEPGKGDELRKKAYALLADMPGFVGNVEGRDFMRPGVDVIVTDGFTGNVALKTMEGAIRGTASLVFGVLEQPELHDAAAEITPPLLEAAKAIDPDYVGGAALLGVKGVCVVGHGSSSARAITSAIRQAVDCVDARVVERTKGAIEDAR